MGFMDKVKAQATVLVDKAQTGVQQGQTKIQEMQSGKQVDRLLRDLGAYVFLSERGRTQPDSEAKVSGIMSQLDALEAAGNPVAVTVDPLTVPPSGAVPVSGTVPQSSTPLATSAEETSPPVANPIPQAGSGLPQGDSSIPQSSSRLPGE